MAIKQDLSDLPRAEREDTGGGLAPDASPRFVGALAELWAREHDEDKPTAMGTRFRHSDAGKCARALGYIAAGIPKSDPMDLTGVWNVRLGSMVHDAWQKALALRYPGAEIELRARIEGFDGSCHIDAVVREECADCGGNGEGVEVKAGQEIDYECPSCDGRGTTNVISIELKTIGGFGFKGAVGKAARGRAAEGPKTEHLLQASLNALAVSADEAVVAYLAKECISQKVGEGMTDLDRFAAEWTFTREQYEPLARREMERVTGILKLVDSGTLPARKIPDLPASAEVVDPATSRWEQTDADGRVVDTGTVWNGQFCMYCSHFTLCQQTPSGRIPVEQAVKISAKAAA